MPSARKKVMVFGTFDIFHKGHISFLRQAKKNGAFLTVVIARDGNVEKVKGKPPRNNEKNRLRIVKKSGLADLVIIGRVRDAYALIRKHQPDIIALGYDQTAFVDKLSEKLFSFGMKNVKITRLKAYRPDIYKSSKMKMNGKG